MSNIVQRCPNCGNEEYGRTVYQCDKCGKFFCNKCKKMTGGDYYDCCPACLSQRFSTYAYIKDENRWS